jgi:carboxyl-terminal processing protease
MTVQKTKIWLPLILSITLIIGMLFGYKLKENMGDFAPSFASLNNQVKLNELLDLIDRKYVDSVSFDSLQQKTIQTIISELDPHSIYIPAEEVNGMNEELDGNYHGIGVQFDLFNDTVHILSVMKGSPAAMSGLQPADKIIKVDSFNIAGVHINEGRVQHLVKGEKGTTVMLVIQRNNKTFSVSLKRNRIKSTNIDAAFFIEPGIGFIRINKFSGNTYEEFMEHLERMKNEGMQKLILDLRDNGGGMLDDAIEIADEFISGNKQIVSTKGYNVAEQIISARRPGLFEEGKLVLLINENSASASEVLAGALQDWNRATIIGRRSFGKGLVQEQFSLSDGSAIRLTVARYYTPVGRSIQKPYKHGEDTGYTQEISQRIKNGNILRDHENSHVGKVFKLQDGRTLYSEEGIAPDIFVPIDSMRWLLSDRVPDIQDKITVSGLRYYTTHAQQLRHLKQLSDLKVFLSKDPSVDILMNLWCQSLPSGVNISRCKELFFSDFEDFLSWMIWHQEGYFRSLISKEPVVLEALSVIRN